MAQRGSDSLNVNVGTVVTGSVNIDTKNAAKELFNLERELKNIMTLMSNMSRGHDVSAYWNEQAASIDSVIDALEEFKRNTNSIGGAENLVKAMNAFTAWHPNEDMSAYFAKLGSGAQDIIDKAKQMASGLDSAFSVPALREAFDTLSLLKSTGADLDQIFSKLKAGDVSGLMQQVEMLESKLARTTYRMQELQDQVDRYESGDTFNDMRDRLEQFEEAMSRAKDEFRSFLSANGFAGDDLDEHWGRFAGLFEKIENGSMTVREAMAQVRQEYSYMFQNVGSDQILDVISKLEELGIAIEGIRQSLSNLGMGSSATASIGEMKEYLSEGAEAAANQREELSQLSAQSVTLNGLIDVLTKLAQAGTDAEAGASSVHQSLIELLKSVQQLGNVDIGNLQQISDILRSFVRMDGINVGKASVQNLVSALESLSRLPSTSTLTGLAAIDFSNFNNLKLSKTYLKNLADFIPTISEYNIEPLKQLAGIDWTNLNSLHVPKASLSGLADMLSVISASNTNNASNIAPAIQDAVSGVGSVETAAESAIESVRELKQEVSDVAQGRNINPDHIVQIDALADRFAEARKLISQLKKEFIAALSEDPQWGNKEVFGDVTRAINNLHTNFAKSKELMAELSEIRDKMYDSDGAVHWSYLLDTFDEIIAKAEEMDKKVRAAKTELEIANIDIERDALGDPGVIASEIDEAMERAKTGVRGVRDEVVSLSSAEEQAAESASRISTATETAAGDAASASSAMESVADSAQAEKSSMEGVSQSIDAVSDKFNSLLNIIQLFADVGTSIGAVRDAINDLAASVSGLNDNLNAIDTAKLNAIGGNISATTGKAQEIVPVEIDIKSAQAALSKIGVSLDDLKSKITETFDLSKAREDAENLAQSYEKVRGALELIRDLAVASVKATQQANEASTGTYKSNASIASLERTLSSLERIKGLKFLANDDAVAKYNEQLEKMRDLLSQIHDSSGDERSSLINQFKAEAEEARNLRDTLNEVAQWNDQLSKRLGDLNAGKITGLDPSKIKLDLIPDSEIAKVDAYKQKWQELKQQITDSFSLSGADRQKAELRINEMVAELVRLKSELDEIATAAKAAVDAGNTDAVEDRTDSEKKKLKELIEQYEKLYQAKTDAARASANGNNQAGVDAANARAAEAQKTINGLIEENAELDKTARAHERVKKAIYNHQQALNSISAKNISDENKEVDKLQARLDKLGMASPKMTFGGNPAAVEKYTAALQDAQYAIDAIQGKTGDAREAAIAAADQAIAQVQKLGAELNKQEKQIASHKTLWQSLSEGWRKFGGWSIVTRSFTKIISTMKNMVTAVKEVDAAMTELRKVTDETESSYDKFLNTASQMATRVGAKLSDTILATSDFARLGFSLEESTKLAESALLYFNIGDGLESINAATESLISSMKAFQISASDSISIVDMLNEVGNNFAISSAGIGEALQRSASALATAGNTIEESIGLIVAANDVVQNPESVGVEFLRPVA